MSYDTYTHAEDDRVCILIEDGTWFVPLDAGGEGYGCERQHGPSPHNLEQQVRQLRETLALYADPESYHAIGFWFDPPCGRFAEDFSNDHGDAFYDRAMPGAAARAALQGHTTEEETT